MKTSTAPRGNKKSKDALQAGGKRKRRERGWKATARRGNKSPRANRSRQTRLLQAAHGETERKRERRRWIALAVLCLGQLMMVLDATIVNVALPSIQRELHFSQGQPHLGDQRLPRHFRGGFLLLAGRMGDLVGRKKVFLTGLVMFTAASVLVRVRPGSETMLIVSRIIQGIGGAVASSVILAIIVTEFPERVEQAKAMGMYAFVSAAGGSVGLLAGRADTVARFTGSSS